MTSEQHARRLLDELGITHLCDVDLLVFFARHPRALLASDQLAAFTGYSLPQIAESLDVLVQLGALRRTVASAHAARMYVFTPAGSNGNPLTALLEFVSARQGRLAMKRALLHRSTDDARGAESGEAFGAGARPTLVRPLMRAGDANAGARRGGIR
jgi:hypothetical protein